VGKDEKEEEELEEEGVWERRMEKRSPAN